MSQHVPPATGSAPPATATRIDSYDEKASNHHLEAGYETNKPAPIIEEDGEIDQFGGHRHISPEELKLRRKLDSRIIVILWVMYYLNYIDRAAIASARLDNLETHLGLTGNQFNVCVSILFVGYTVFQVPSNMLMSTNKVRPSLWMCGWMMAWACVSACSALAKNFTHLVVLRFILGCVEAPFFPGAIYMLSLFYTRREIATRISLMYSANIIAIATSGLISAGIFAGLGGRYGIHGWQWLFIIEGVITFGVAFIAMFILPDHPLHTRWLTPEQRQLAQDRMDRDTVGLEQSKGAIAGLKQAVTDGKLWVLVIMQTCHLASCGFNSFFPTVIKTLGHSNVITLVLTCPPYVVSGLFAVGLAWNSGRMNERTFHISGAMIFAIVGFVVWIATKGFAGRYAACFLFCIGAYGGNSIILGWVSSTCGQTSEKKAASLSIVNMIANASFIYTPYLYPSSDGPNYTMAMSANAAFAFGTLACAWILRFWLQVDNKRLKAADPNTTLFFAY